jgi:RNA-splicing ligase RtcB
VSQHFHAVVWIDHHQARVFHFNADDAERAVVHPQHAERHIEHKGNSIGSGHPAEDQAFFHSVVEAIGSASAVLIGGPASAKHELFKYIQRHAHQLLPRIAAVETLDHPTDGELVAHARQYFRAADRMAPQRS